MEQLKTVFFSMGLSLLSLLPLSTAVAAETILVLNTTGNVPLSTPDQNGFIDRVVAEALRRVGLGLKTVNLPPERALQNVNDGIDDGDMVRIAGLEKIYPNLVRVPEKVMDWEFSAFSKQPLELGGSWSNLSPYSVSFIIGWKILEKNVPQSSYITRVKTPQQLFGLLANQRTDIVLYERWGGLKYLQDNGITDVELLQPPLAVREMYIYLNKRHEKLVPKIAAALLAMKKDGTYERIYQQTLASLVKAQR